MPGANKPETQNPLIALPAAQRIRQMSPEFRREWKQLCLELAGQAAAKGDYNWGKRKYMNAAYWRVVAVYARHASRLGNTEK